MTVPSEAAKELAHKLLRDWRWYMFNDLESEIEQFEREVIARRDSEWRVSLQAVLKVFQN